MARKQSVSKTIPIQKPKAKSSKRSSSSPSSGFPSPKRRRTSPTPSSKKKSITATVTPSSKKTKVNKDKDSNGGGSGDKHKSISSRSTRSQDISTPSSLEAEENSEDDSDPDPTRSESKNQLISTSIKSKLSKSRGSSRKKTWITADDSLTEEIHVLLSSKDAKERAELLKRLREINKLTVKKSGNVKLVEVQIEDEDMDEDGEASDNGGNSHSQEDEGEDEDETMFDEQDGFERKREEFIAQADEAVDNFAAAFEERHQNYILILKTSSTKTIEDYKSAMATYANDGIINHARKYLQALMNTGNIAVDKWDEIKFRLDQHGKNVRELFIKLDTCDKEIDRLAEDVKEQFGQLFDHYETRREECKLTFETKKGKYRQSYEKATDAERKQKEINIHLKAIFGEGSK